MSKSVMWQGLPKLVEEMGELQQVLGKLIPFPEGEHPDGAKHLKLRLEEELGHVLAAIEYLIIFNALDRGAIQAHGNLKLELYKHFGLTGVPNPPVQ
ncbi:MAG: hypothetical protein ACXWWG_00565 [Nitrospira sp.]